MRQVAPPLCPPSKGRAQIDIVMDLPSWWYPEVRLLESHRVDEMIANMLVGKLHCRYEGDLWAVHRFSHLWNGRAQSDARGGV